MRLLTNSQVRGLCYWLAVQENLLPPPPPESEQKHTAPRAPASVGSSDVTWPACSCGQIWALLRSSRECECSLLIRSVSGAFSVDSVRGGLLPTVHCWVLMSVRW